MEPELLTLYDGDLGPSEGCTAFSTIPRELPEAFRPKSLRVVTTAPLTPTRVHLQGSRGDGTWVDLVTIPVEGSALMSQFVEGYCGHVVRAVLEPLEPLGALRSGRITIDLLDQGD